MITIAFSNGSVRTFGAWCRMSVIDAYCKKHSMTGEIINYAR